MVASSMGQSGFAGSAEQSAMYADDATASGRQQECGYTNEGDFNLGGTFGQISFNLDYDYNVALNCNGDNEPESFSADFDYEGGYNGPRVSSLTTLVAVTWPLLLWDRKMISLPWTVRTIVPEALKQNLTVKFRKRASTAWILTLTMWWSAKRLTKSWAVRPMWAPAKHWRKGGKLLFWRNL